MSSHHFVKEGQEPALLILNSTAILFEKAQELLEWSPFVIVAEDQLESVLAWGIKIDAILCEQSNRFIIDEQLKDHLPLQFISCHLSVNGLKNSVKYLVEKKYTALNLLAKSTDDFIEVENSEGIAIEIFLNNQKWTLIKSRPFEKWVSAGTSLSIFPTTAQVSTSGLSKTLTSYQDGMVKIWSAKIFWVGEQID